MLTLIFVILMFIVFGKLLGIAIKAAWGISKFIVTFLVFPVFLIVLAVCGLVYLAIPILAIIGICALVKSVA